MKPMMTVRIPWSATCRSTGWTKKPWTVVEEKRLVVITNSNSEGNRHILDNRHKGNMHTLDSMLLDMDNIRVHSIHSTP